MANMHFKADLLPSTDLGYSLGSSNERWKIYGIVENGLEIKGHVAGDSSTTTGHGLYSGGGYHNAYNNIVLHGDASTGTSGIAFVSDKVAADGTITNVNAPSDRAFIQWHSCGVTTYSAEGTAPTLATSGEVNILVIGVGNDATDQVRIQTPGRTGLLHQVGNTGYVIPDTNNTSGTVGSGTQPVWVEGGIIKNTTYTLAKSVPSNAVFTDTNNAVRQSASTTANWRKVLLHYKDDAASTTAVTDSTNQVYATVGISVQPSTNTLRASAFNVLDKVTLQYNTTTNALDFVFI